MIVLNGPAEPSSRPKLEGLPVERNMNVPPAPRALSMEEKVGLLKSAGLEAFDEKLTPYVTLTPQQPQVAGKGVLEFYYPRYVLPDGDNRAFFANSPDLTIGLMGVIFNFETKGMYLMTLTVQANTTGAPEFYLLEWPDGPTQTFVGKKTAEWQHFNMIVEVAKPGKYEFTFSLAGKDKYRSWYFGSCDVTILKK